MFTNLRERVTSSVGMKVCSFEDLETLDLDSVDSICLSDTSSIKSVPTIKSDGSFQSNASLIQMAKSKVSKILRTIKKLEKIHELKKEAKMPMTVFMDLIRDQQYSHVSMTLLPQFMEICKMVPKSYYLHYYVFFLHYASYYHHHRANVDVIDENKKKIHKYYLVFLKYQLKYIEQTLKESREKL